MKKKKDAVRFGAGALAVAALVAILLLVWGGSSEVPQTAQPIATTTPEQPVVPAPAKPSAQAPAPVDMSVRGVASRVSGARIFAGLLESTGVGAALAGGGTYTVFVPTDTAFSLQGAGFLSSMNAAQKKRLAQYHVIAGKALDLDAISSGNHQAVSQDTLNFNVDLTSMRAYVNSGVSISQQKAQNGIVYVISAVLVPPQSANPATGSTGTPTPR